jgi:hypothetical protein
MNRDTAIRLPEPLHRAKNEFYWGGSGTAFQPLLAPVIALGDRIALERR